MKAVIIGAGKQGRGILAYLCRLNQIDYTLVDRSKSLITAFDTHLSYCLHLLSDGTKDHEEVELPCAKILSIEDPSFYEVIASADLIFTSTSNDQLQHVGQSIAIALTQLFQRGIPCTEKNIILCENVVDPVASFETGLYQTLASSDHEIVKEQIGICEALSMSVSAQPPHQVESTSLDIWAQNLMRIYINKYRMKGDLPKIKGIHYVDNFIELKKQALYTNNTSSAFISYLGHLKGYQTLPEAMSDKSLVALLDRCYQEINDTLVKELGVSPKDQRAFAQLAKNKYQSIEDTIQRHAREVIRKLGKDERLAGICLKAVHNGILPDTISIGLAAALFYEDEQDAQSMKVKQVREQHGVAYLIKEVCQIEESSPLHALILQKVKWLQDQGYLHS